MDHSCRFLHTSDHSLTFPPTLYLCWSTLEDDPHD